MHSPQQAYSGMRIKGGLLRARFLFIILNHGPDVWARILESLPQEDRAAIQEINVDDWYSLRALDDLDRAIVNALGSESPEAVFDQLGEFSATTSLSGPYSSLLNPDIHSFLQQSALIHRTYQDFGSASYSPRSDTSGVLTINYETAPPASFCISGTAYFRHAIEMCGARSARITHTRCRSRGDAVCEFYFTWQP
ncbi:MAG TPA: hypothetical protein VF747_06195 [Blastocatellia bacterium]|jgi:hypothetical protein